jgi:predicted enzyme related to lactoylglutathione lyase
VVAALAEWNNQAMSTSAEPSVARPGGISYLHIPSTEPSRTAAFYRSVFDWTIRDPDAQSPAFEDGSGHVIGHFVDEQPVAGDAGLRPYIYVEDVPATVERILANEGEVLKAPFAEGDLTVAIFSDPAGNVLGVWQFSSARP